MRLLPVLILETHNQTNNKCLPKFVQTHNASSSKKRPIWLMSLTHWTAKFLDDWRVHAIAWWIKFINSISTSTSWKIRNANRIADFLLRIQPAVVAKDLIYETNRIKSCKFCLKLIFGDFIQGPFETSSLSWSLRCRSYITKYMFLLNSRWPCSKLPNTRDKLILKTNKPNDFLANIWWFTSRNTVFSSDVTAAMLVSPTNPLGIELYSYAKDSRWFGDVIWRTGKKNFNAVSYNRARP